MTYIDGSIDCRVRFTEKEIGDLAGSLRSIDGKMDRLIDVLRANNPECVNEDLKAENDRLKTEYYSFYMNVVEWILREYTPSPFLKHGGFGEYLSRSVPEGLSEGEAGKVREALRRLGNGI